MTETPTERAERVERLYEAIADAETFRNDARVFAAECNRLESRLMQARITIDAQARELAGYVEQRDADAKRIAELEALLAKLGNRTPGCNHGPDMQCVECVPDDGFSFRPLGLGPAGNAT